MPHDNMLDPVHKDDPKENLRLYSNILKYEFFM
jgi:hypothetical protein